MHPIFAFVIGLFIGGAIGTFIMRLMSNASRCEKLIDDNKTKTSEEKHDKISIGPSGTTGKKNRWHWCQRFSLYIG